MTDNTEIDSFAKFISDLRDDVDLLPKSRSKTVISGVTGLPIPEFFNFNHEFKADQNVLISASDYVYDGDNPDTSYKTIPINVAQGRATKIGFSNTIIGPLAGGVAPPWGRSISSIGCQLKPKPSKEGLGTGRVSVNFGLVKVK